MLRRPVHPHVRGEHLVELGKDSSERFYDEWTAGWLPIPRCTCRSEDLYQAYRHWCSGQGVAKPAQQSTFVGAVSKRPGVLRGRHQHYKHHSRTVTMQSVLVTPPDATRPDGMQPLSDAINAFAEALRTWREEAAATSAQADHGRGRNKVANGRPLEDDDGPY
jgi:hypothetical protein